MTRTIANYLIAFTLSATLCLLSTGVANLLGYELDVLSYLLGLLAVVIQKALTPA